MKNSVPFSEELFNFLDQNQSWNDFARSLMRQFASKGGLTKGQVEAAQRMKDKMDAKQAAKAATPQTVLKGIPVAFQRAQTNGLKRPRLVFGNTVLSLAGKNSVNAGFIYVKHDGDYAGKISPAGYFTQRGTDQTLVQKLASISVDPFAAALKYGRETGTCACCARDLTDPNSIADGIGPVCKKKWGWK